MPGVANQRRCSAPRVISPRRPRCAGSRASPSGRRGRSTRWATGGVRARGPRSRRRAHEPALALLPEPDSERAAVATFLAEALAYLGRLDDAESALREAAEIGRRLGDHRVRAYAAWTWTTLASLRGDAAATIQRVRAVERHPGDWFEHPTGAEFLADAALALARVGEGEAALAYAARARDRAEALGHPEIAWIATGAVEARFGDPALALDVLA